VIKLENAYLNTIRYFSEIKNGTLGMLDRKHKMIESPVVFYVCFWYDVDFFFEGGNCFSVV